MSKRTLSTSLLLAGLLSLRVGVAHAETEPMNFNERVARELAVPGGLTAEELAKRAVTTSYTISARRQDVVAARENRAKAKSGYLPKLTVQARYTRLSDIGTNSMGSIVAAPGISEGVVDPTTDTLVAVPLRFPNVLDNYAFTAGLAVPVSDYFLRVAKADAAAGLLQTAAEKDVLGSERALATDARGLYYAWVGARLTTLIAEDALELAKAHGVDVRAAVAAGTASRADELTVEVQISESTRLLDSARHSQAEYEERIRIARHDPPGTHYTIGEDFRAEPPELGIPERQEDLVSYAVRHRPELAALSARAEALSRSADVERAGMFPRLDLFANANYSNPNQRVFPAQEEFRGSWDAGAQLTWVVSDLPGANAATNAAQASSAAVRADARALEDQIRRDVATALQALLEARSAITTTDTSLRAAAESYRVRRALFQNGRATSTELQDSEVALSRARLAVVNARLQLRVSRARLEYAIGRGEVRQG